MPKGSPVLYIFSGLPGVGKSTLASALAKRVAASYLRVDAIEQALKDSHQKEIGEQGYKVAFALAKDNLQQGLCVVADSCNALIESRKAWQQVAKGLGIKFVNIEVRCSDITEHRYRVESRRTSIANLVLPSWKQVQQREYLPWTGKVVSLNTAGKTINQSIDELFSILGVKVQC